MGDAKFDVEGFAQDVQATLRASREAFDGKYATELRALVGMSREDINKITLDVTGPAIYDALISVVKKASHQNLAQAELVWRIKQLGEVATKIASKVPGLIG